MKKTRRLIKHINRIHILLTYHIGHSKVFCIAESTFCTSPIATIERSILHSQKYFAEEKKKKVISFGFDLLHPEAVFSPIWLFYNMLSSIEHLAAIA